MIKPRSIALPARSIPGVAVIAVALALAGCEFGGSLATPEEITRATRSVDATVRVTAQVQVGWELLSVAGGDTCGDTAQAVAESVAAQIRVEAPCLRVDVAANGAREVDVTLASSETCIVRGHAVSGSAILRVSAGAGAEVTADFTGLTVDGATLPVSASFAGCGDERSYALRVVHEGVGEDEASYAFDARFSTGRDHGGLLDRTVFQFDAEGSIAFSGRRDFVAITGLRYRVGDRMPSGGTFRIRTASGMDIGASFFGESPVVGHIDLAIDAHAVVTIPTIH